MPNKYVNKKGETILYKYDFSKYKKPKIPKDQWKKQGRPQKKTTVIKNKIKDFDDEQLNRVLLYIENIIYIENQNED